MRLLLLLWWCCCFCCCCPRLVVVVVVVVAVVLLLLFLLFLLLLPFLFLLFVFFSFIFSFLSVSQREVSLSPTATPDALKRKNYQGQDWRDWLFQFVCSLFMFACRLLTWSLYITARRVLKCAFIFWQSLNVLMWPCAVDRMLKANDSRCTDRLSNVPLFESGLPSKNYNWPVFCHRWYLSSVTTRAIISF